MADETYKGEISMEFLNRCFGNPEIYRGISLLCALAATGASPDIKESALDNLRGMFKCDVKVESLTSQISKTSEVLTEIYLQIYIPDSGDFMKRYIGAIPSRARTFAEPDGWVHMASMN